MHYKNRAHEISDYNNRSLGAGGVWGIIRLMFSFIQKFLKGKETLHDACEKGDIQSVKQHLSAGADLNAIDDDWGMTPLILTADDAHIKIAELLIANGADLNSKSRSVGMTSLHAAACDNHKEITALFIVKGADINAKDSNNKTPLNYAEEEKNTDLATFLRKHGGKTGEELKAAGN